MITKLAVPSQLLTEGVGLATGSILIDATRGILGITMILVVSTGLCQRLIVNTEYQIQLDAASPAKRLLVRTEGHIGTHTGIVCVIEVVVQRQVTKGVEVIGNGTAVLTIVKLDITEGIIDVITLSIFQIDRIDRAHELSGVPGVRGCRTVVGIVG